MSSIQGRTITQLSVASTVQDTDLMLINRPSLSDPTQRDMQVAFSLISSAVKDNTIQDTCISGDKVTYSVDKILSLLKSLETAVQPIIGEIRYLTGSDYAGWLKCDGSMQSPLDYPDLFNILGKNFGGDGINTFSVPDLKGRILMAQGKGTGLSITRGFGITGSETATITSENLPYVTSAQISTSGSYRAGVQTAQSPVVASKSLSITPPCCVAGDYYIFAKYQSLFNI